MTPSPLKLVIFDCDGVLIDSEGPSNRLIAEELTRLGWPMTEAESTTLFIGSTLESMPATIEAHLGHALPENWVEHLRQKMIAAFDTIQVIPGALEALQATAALGVPFRIASNSSHEEMDVKFRQTGLAPLIAGRNHSARDVARGKPAPDVFLAAAAAEGVPPAACLVIEDSVPGIRAAVAAGMTVVALDLHGNAAVLRAEGATPISGLSDLAPLLRSALHQAA